MDVILVLKCVIHQVVKGLVSHQTDTSTEGLLKSGVYNR